MNGRWAGFWCVCVALVVLLFAGGAVAQDSIAVIEGAITEAPEELPGEYEVAMTVHTMHPGTPAATVCACTETSVELHLGPMSDWVVDASFEPAVFTVDWVGERASGNMEGHVQDVTLRFTVGEDKVGDEPHSLTLDGEGSSDTVFHDVDVVPTQVTVYFPEGETADGGDEEVSMAEASQEEGSDVPFVGGVVSVMTVGLVGMLARRARA